MTLEQRLEQQATEQDLTIIENGQMLTDLELRILELEAT